MEYIIELEPAFVKSLEKIKDAQTKKLLKAQINRLEATPFCGKGLSGEMKMHSRLSLV